MKRLFFVLLLFSCSHQSTESKLKSRLEEIEKSDFEKRGEKPESITLDSLSYGIVSKQRYYADQSSRALDAYISDLKYHYYKETAMLLKKAKQLDSTAKVADTTKNLYWVEYHLGAKTDKNTYDNKMTRYLQMGSLDEVKQINPRQ